MHVLFTICSFMKKIQLTSKKKKVSILLLLLYLWASHKFPDTSILNEET